MAERELKGYHQWMSWANMRKWVRTSIRREHFILNKWDRQSIRRNGIIEGGILGSKEVRFYRIKRRDGGLTISPPCFSECNPPDDV